MKKITRITLTLMPLVLSIGTFATFFAVKVNNENNSSSIYKPGLSTHESGTSESGGGTGKFIPTSKFKIFPVLHQNEFYQYIVIKSGKAILNDDFIAKVVNKVIKSSQISNGHIEWGYQYNDGNFQSLSITFKWFAEMQNRILRKTYNFKISKVYN